MGEYIRITFKQIRERVKSMAISEDKMREDIYRDNPSYTNPNEDIERIVQRIYHPTSSDLDEELSLGL